MPDNQPQNTPATMRSRRGPRHGVGSQLPGEDSESLRFFRELTAGLSNRLPVPNLEMQRAGTAMNPVTGLRRLVMGMRTAGIPKERVVRLQVYIGRTIESVYPMDQTPLSVAAQKAMELEGLCDLAEKQQDLQECLDTIDLHMKRLTDEIAADQVLLAKLARRREQLEAGQ